MKTRTAILAIALLACASRAAAVPFQEGMQLSESLSIVVIHGGPACSSGWHQDAAGQCASDEAPAAPAWLPAQPPVQLEAVALSYGAGDPELVPNPEPATLVLLASTLAAAGAAVRRRRR